MSEKVDNFHKLNKNLSNFAKEFSLSDQEENSSSKTEKNQHTSFSSHYEEKEFISEGGLKKVYRMYDCKTGRDVAMARLRDEQQSSKNQERFLREARILASLEHVNIVPLHEIDFDEDENPYFTMKLLSGETLRSVLKKINNGDKEYSEKYHLRTLLEIFQDVCDAMTYAHAENIIHLDLKPENIQISKFNEVSVLDWGFAKRIGDKEDSEYSVSDLPSHTPISSSVTQVGTVNGTPGYLSPEQASKGKLSINKSSDIYSLGATLYAILYLCPPHSELSGEEIINATANGTEISFPDKSDRGSVPPALKAITKKALHHDPETRYSTVYALREDIHRYLNDFSTQAEEINISRILLLFLKRHYVGTLILLIISLIIVTISYYSLKAVQEKEMKIMASSNEVISGAFRKETELRIAGMYQEAIDSYLKLLKFGYNQSKLHYNLAVLYAGNLELDKSLYHLDKLEGLNEGAFDYLLYDGPIIHYKTDFTKLKDLYAHIQKFHQRKLSLDNDKDAAAFAYPLSDVMRYHVFSSINKNPNTSLDEKLSKLNRNLLELNRQIKKDLNIEYVIDKNNLSLDLSNNKDLNKKSPIMGLAINDLNISNTDMNMANYTNYQGPGKNLRKLNISNIDSTFSQMMLNQTKLETLIAKNCTYRATKLSKATSLKYLDIEGGSSRNKKWVPSKTLEYLNIAFSDFNDLNLLSAFSSLKTLVIDDSMILPKNTKAALETRGVDIVIKAKR